MFRKGIFDNANITKRISYKLIPNNLTKQVFYYSNKPIKVARIVGIVPNPNVSDQFILDKNREKAHQPKISFSQKIGLLWKQYGIIGLSTYVTVKSSVFVGSYLMFQYNIIHPETLYIPYFSHLLHVPDILDWISQKSGYNIPSGHKTDSIIGAIALTKLGWYIYFPFSLWITPKISNFLGFSNKHPNLK